MSASYPKVDPVEADPVFTASGATDAEVAAAVAVEVAARVAAILALEGEVADDLAAAMDDVDAALALKQAAATAATDAELAAVEAALEADVALKQDAITAATDAELSAAVSSLTTAISAKQDAATAATDAEVAAAIAAHAAGDATDAELAATAATLQPLDSDLTAIAALATTATGRSLLAAADASAIRAIADAQQADTDLAAIAALTTTATGRSLLAATDAAAIRAISAAAAQSDFDLAQGAYRLIHSRWGLYGAATAASTQLMYSNGFIAVGANNSGVCAFYLDPADLPTIPGKTKKLRVRGWLINNAVAAPGIGFTFVLHPVTAFASASGAYPRVSTIGATLVSPGVANPAANAVSGPHSQEIDFPAAGWYVMGAFHNATLPSGNLPQIIVELAWRHA
jgi:hypothetical protein